MQKLSIVKEITDLPSPLSFSIWWNGGSILGFMLGVQLITGIFLSMHYTADLVSTFYSIIHIMRDVPNGWVFRLIHTNGASFFFIFLYLHVGRGIYYQSFLTQPRTWMVGSTIFLMCMGTAFLGYVLPWGQMSFWGATVITNLLSAIPYFGNMMVEWVWGGFSVGQSTLNRFFSLHFLLPFLISVLAMVHLVFLHDKGSTNPLGDLNHVNKIQFHPYYSWKDLVGIFVVLLMLLIVCFFLPTMLSDPENYMMANPMVTPVHIQPEWYFLFAYAILRSIPSKLGGVIALALSVLILYVLPLGSLKWSVPSSFNMFFQIIFWGLIVNFLLLTWLGACPIEEPYFSLSQPLTALFFVNFLLLMIEPWFVYHLLFKS
uniref:cytochrome b n=1 Tax=Ambigolimax valentianus TaxID=1338344 RepID=UPI0024112A9D|nr:cytochrome b [Ambigolimax valentianus]WEI33078.1 cytochrome b [Ambigolimax valentianus]